MKTNVRVAGTPYFSCSNTYVQIESCFEARRYFVCFLDGVGGGTTGSTTLHAKQIRTTTQKHLLSTFCGGDDVYPCGFFVDLTSLSVLPLIDDI